MRADRSRWTGLLLLLGCLALRVVVVALDVNTFSRDEDDYGRLATNLATTGTYGYPVVNEAGEVAKMRPTAYRPPGYPLLLRMLMWDGRLTPARVAALHVGLGWATVLMVYFIARRYKLQWSWIPALAVACDPILLRSSQLIMTETFITLLTVAIWWIWLRLTQSRESGLEERPVRRRPMVNAALLGLLLGYATLTRPTMLPWTLLLIGLFVMHLRLEGNRPAMLATIVLAMAAVLLPWLVRNYQYLGQPIWATTHGGYTLLLANNPPLYQHFKNNGPGRDWDANQFHRLWAARRSGDPREASFWDVTTSHIAGPSSNNKTSDAVQGVADAPDIDELADDKLAQQAALATIRREPSMFCLSSLYRVGWLWAIFPYESGPRVKLVIGIWYGCWFTLACIGAARLRGAWLSSAWLAPGLLLLTLTAVHAVYWSNMRMRAPLMPVIYIVACWPWSCGRSKHESE